MLTLVTSNPAKYAPFTRDLERLRLAIEPPAQPLPEIQSLIFTETLTAKARAAAALFGRPVLVDDAGLVLEDYAPFPGPLTATVLRSLGPKGLGRLLAGASNRAVMECHLGCWINGALRSWTGAVRGRIDLSRPPRDKRMPLSDLFIPDASEAGRTSVQRAEPGAAAKRARAGSSKATVPLLSRGAPGTKAPALQGARPGHSALLHRALAIAALEKDIFELHLETAPPEMGGTAACAPRSGYNCPFCAEFQDDGLSLFASMMGDRLPCRVVYEDEYFVVMPPLGEFMEGGLLVLSREHVLSLAHLPPAQFDRLERLLKAIQRALAKRWGAAAVVFEHGPAPDLGKGVCCVDHAHLNIFPAPVHVHPHLAARMNLSVGPLSELAKLRRAEFGYLFVQENDGSRRAYDGQNVPTQLVRRILTAQLGLPKRWHWRDYVGRDELLATYNALKGQIRL
jgi:inosine/xanthosine triphosphate pyrophosphatase family protein/diadenosine tetraphosphate (Ap4A) HIT family hydrolase